MGRGGRVWLVTLLALGCTPAVTQMYRGARRPEPEIAVLVSSETAIDVLDDQRFRYYVSPNEARYEILPGRHRLRISLFIVRYLPQSADIERSHNEIEVCLDAQAGRTYIIGREGNGDTWRPLISDGKTGAPLPAEPCTKA